MGDEDDVNASKKRKKTTQEEVLREKLSEAQKNNDDLKKKLNEVEKECDFKINFLMKENDSLKGQLDRLFELYKKNVENAESLISSSDDDDDMEAEEIVEDAVVEPSTSKVKNIAVEKAENKKETTFANKKTTMATKKDAVKPKTKSAPSKDSTETEKKTQKRESKSVPVFTTYDIDVRKMIVSIDSILGHRNYNVKILGKNVANIGVCTLVDYEKVRGLLEDQKVNFYTYTPKGLRPFSVVIEGLPCSFEPDEIREYLGGLQISVNIIGLTRLGNDKWILKMSRDSDFRKFYEIRYILRCRVHIRQFDRKGVTQCFNCQRFGHVSTNCRMPYRCVKCAGSHGPGKCLVPRKGDNVQETLTTNPVTGQVIRAVGLPVKCVNCGVDGHVASSNDCPRRAELLRKLGARKASGGGPRSRELSTGRNVVAKGVSYAAAARSVIVNEGSLTTSRSSAHTESVGPSLSIEGAMAQFDLIDRDCSRIFGGGFLQCLGKIGKFAKEYRTLDNDGDRTRALLGVLMTLGQDG